MYVTYFGGREQYNLGADEETKTGPRSTSSEGIAIWNERQLLGV